MRDPIDNWLDAAMTDYADVRAPLGFEARLLARLRQRTFRPGWACSFGFAAVMVTIVAALLTINLDDSATIEIPSISAHIPSPVIERKTAVVAASRPKLATTRNDQNRGVPITAAPLTPQEEAILRLVRNSRAQQLASLTVKHGDLTKESNTLQIQELNIPAVGKEEGQ